MICILPFLLVIGGFIALMVFVAKRSANNASAGYPVWNGPRSDAYNNGLLYGAMLSEEATHHHHHHHPDTPFGGFGGNSFGGGTGGGFGGSNVGGGAGGSFGGGFGGGNSGGGAGGSF